MRDATSRFGNAICSISLFENQAFRSSFCIRTKKISERRDCLFALPVNKKEVINQKNTFLFEFCSRSTVFGCCLSALPDEGKAVEMLETSQNTSVHASVFFSPCLTRERPRESPSRCLKHRKTRVFKKTRKIRWFL